MFPHVRENIAHQVSSLSFVTNFRLSTVYWWSTLRTRWTKTQWRRVDEAFILRPRTFFLSFCDKGVYGVISYHIPNTDEEFCLRQYLFTSPKIRLVSLAWMHPWLEGEKEPQRAFPWMVLGKQHLLVLGFVKLFKFQMIISVFKCCSFCPETLLTTSVCS